MDEGAVRDYKKSNRGLPVGHISAEVGGCALLEKSSVSRQTLTRDVS